MELWRTRNEKRKKEKMKGCGGLGNFSLKKKNEKKKKTKFFSSAKDSQLYPFFVIFPKMVLKDFGSTKIFRWWIGGGREDGRKRQKE